MKKLLIATGLVACTFSSLSMAQAKPEPDYTFTGNAGLFSDYRFRGFTQTDYKPAFQGGFDFAHKSGFYLGNWNSNVEQSLYTGANIEMDFYGGYKGTAGPLGYDVGALYYYYPGSGRGGTVKIKNGELYGGLSYGPFSAKYYHAVTRFFSLGEGTNIDTKGSGYLDLAATFDLGNGWAANAHVGWQRIRNGTSLGLPKNNVTDYKLGVTKDLSGWALGAAVYGTSKKNYFLTGDGEDGGKTKLVLSVSRTF
jgi:uncharacterized protein (TIGR02001 family)